MHQWRINGEIYMRKCVLVVRISVTINRYSSRCFNTNIQSTFFSQICEPLNTLQISFNSPPLIVLLSSFKKMSLYFSQFNLISVTSMFKFIDSYEGVIVCLCIVAIVQAEM